MKFVAKNSMNYTLGTLEFKNGKFYYHSGMSGFYTKSTDVLLPIKKLLDLRDKLKENGFTVITD